MLQFVVLPQSKIFALLQKAWQWFRIGLTFRGLKRGDINERNHAQQALASAMADTRGLAMKIGQFMAGGDDIVNPYHNLVKGVKPLPPHIIIPELEKQLKHPVGHFFKAFADHASAASLGQVHHALLIDGTEVAVKVRYPGIIDAVKAELTLSDWLPSGGPVKRWRINTADYKNVLCRQLLRETDYLIEMQTQTRFKEKLNVPGLHIPKIYPNYCSDGVIVQSWESGQRFNEACTWPKKARLEIGRTLLMALFQSLFVHGEVHGDPHPGNYLFRQVPEKGTETVLLDFGCTILINKQNRLALLKLIDCRRNGKATTADDLFRGFAAMGFDSEKLSHIQSELPQICDVLFQPFLVDRPFPVSQWQISNDLKTLLEERRWWFRSAGPADLFMLLRVFHGLSQQLESLDVALPWWPLLHHVLGDPLLEQARSLELPKVTGLPAIIKTNRDRARKLCVQMIEDGVTRISVDLPAEAAFDLEAIIPSQVLQLLLPNMGEELSEFGNRLKSDGLRPQQLIDVTMARKNCRIWLE